MKNVLITGASRGIGRDIAITLSEEKKYNIILNCKSNIKELKKTEEIILKNCDCMKILADVSKYDECEKMFKEIEDKFGRIDILINNAGIADIELFNVMDIERIRNIIDVNLYSVINCSKLAIPNMINNKNGVIINISSVWGEVGGSMEVIYSTAKAGINGFTKALAKELGPSSVRVNCISLGYFDTEMNNSIDIDEENRIIDEIPLCRLGKPNEVGKLCKFLISNENLYMTGQIIRLDGGWI